MIEFAIFGIAWWVLALSTIAFGILVAITSSEKPISGLIFFIASWAAITFLVGINPFVYLAANAGNLLVWLGVYLLMGVAYAYAKWTWIYLPSAYVQKKIVQNFEDFKSNWSSKFGVTKTNDELIEKFTKSDYYPFGLRQDKWKISTWVLWWPLNLLWSLFDDVVVNVWNWSASVLSGSFASIAKSQVKKTINKTPD